MTFVDQKVAKIIKREVRKSGPEDIQYLWRYGSVTGGEREGMHPIAENGLHKLVLFKAKAGGEE